MCFARVPNSALNIIAIIRMHCLALSVANVQEFVSCFTDVLFENDTPHVQLRARSNSAESWSAAMQQTANNSSSHRHTTDWLPPMSVSTDDSHRSKVGRQDSYVSALKSKVPGM